MSAKDRPDATPNRARLTAQTKLKRYKSFMNMNWKSRANINPVLMGWLGKTVGGSAFTHVVLDKNDDEGAEITMRAAYEGEEGAIELEFGATRRTAALLLSFVTAEWPGYKVQKGRLRTIPVEFLPDENPPGLVLKMKDSTVELSPNQKKRNGTSAESKAGHQTAAAQQPEED